EFDILYEKSIIESDFEKRTKMYQELDQIIMNNSVIIPLYYDQVLRFSHKNIKGFYANAQNLLDLTKVIKE
ncbi:MAG: ABC transporter substrate-binding protein, partial [Flavobacteriales bacterium]|nr:ABC transporter substrate-binding protein [Flavobacteriales bacterium]